MKKILLFLVGLSVAIGVAVYLFVDTFHTDESKRRKVTSIDMSANDPEGNFIGFANVVFLDGNRKIVKTATLTSGSGRLGEYAFEPGSGMVIKPYYVDSDWGKGVESVRIEAFGCGGSGPAKVVEDKRGSGWALSHTFHVEYTVTATIETRAIDNTPGDAALLQQLINFVQLGPNRTTHEREYLYSVALHELQRIGAGAEIALPLLIGMIKNNPPEVLQQWPEKSDLIAAIVAVGKNSNDTVPALQNILTNKELSSFYQPTISALGEMGYGTEGVMPALIASLEYDREYRALPFFSEWGDKASAAVPAIIDLLKTSNDRAARGSMLYTLKRIGTIEALQAYEEFSSQP
jgi:hypothetical protein